MATSADQSNAVAFGSLTAAIAVNSGTTVVKASAGMLGKVIVTTAGTASVTIYDNASAASGRVLFITPATTTLGSIFDVHMPAANGITVSAPASSAGITLSYS